MGDATDCKFQRACLVFFPVEWVQKSKQTENLLETEFAVVSCGTRGLRSTRHGSSSMKAVCTPAWRPAHELGRASRAERRCSLKAVLARPSELQFKPFYLDLYLERVTFSELLLPVRSHRRHRITSSRRIQALIKDRKSVV